MPSLLTLVVASIDGRLCSAVRDAAQRLMVDNLTVQAGSIPALHRALQRYHSPHLVVLDSAIADRNRSATLLELSRRYPDAPLVVVVDEPSATVAQRAIELGAVGVLPRQVDTDAIELLLRSLMEETDPAVQRHALHAQERGVSYREFARSAAKLTPRRLRVLMLIDDGHSNKIIAERLHITEATVKAHTTAILKKLGVKRRTQAVLLAHRLFQD